MYHCVIPKCPVRIITDSEETLIRHYKAFHSHLKFICYVCGRTFGDQNVLFYHLNICANGEEIDKTKIKVYDSKMQVSYLMSPWEVQPVEAPKPLPPTRPAPPKRSVPDWKKKVRFSSHSFNLFDK